jgi:hypothetical protein
MRAAGPLLGAGSKCDGGLAVALMDDRTTHASDRRDETSSRQVRDTHETERKTLP